MASGRMRRVDEAVREVLSDAIAKDLQDPRVGFVTVTGVKTSPDLRHARVFVSVLGDEQVRSDSLVGLRSAMQGMLAPEEVEETLGTAEVRQIFRASRVGTIAGSHVTDGKITRGSRVRLVRDGTVVYDGVIGSLRRFNEDAREVASGFDCGIVLRDFADLKEGDVLEAYTTRQVERELA